MTTPVSEDEGVKSAEGGSHSDTDSDPIEGDLEFFEDLSKGDRVKLKTTGK